MRAEVSQDFSELIHSLHYLLKTNLKVYQGGDVMVLLLFMHLVLLSDMTFWQGLELLPPRRHLPNVIRVSIHVTLLCCFSSNLDVPAIL